MEDTITLLTRKVEYNNLRLTPLKLTGNRSRSGEGVSGFCLLKKKKKKRVCIQIQIEKQTYLHIVASSQGWISENHFDLAGQSTGKLLFLHFNLNAIGGCCSRLKNVSKTYVSESVRISQMWLCLINFQFGPGELGLGRSYYTKNTSDYQTVS